MWRKSDGGLIETGSPRPSGPAGIRAGRSASAARACLAYRAKRRARASEEAHEAAVSVPVLSRCEESSMTSSEERCPTCDGIGSVARNNQRYSCPTCPPKSDASGPYLAGGAPDHSGALRIARSAAYVMGAAALVAVVAVVIKALWH